MRFSTHVSREKSRKFHWTARENCRKTSLRKLFPIEWREAVPLGEDLDLGYSGRQDPTELENPIPSSEFGCFVRFGRNQKPKKACFPRRNWRIYIRARAAGKTRLSMCEYAEGGRGQLLDIPVRRGGAGRGSRVGRGRRARGLRAEGRRA